MYIKDEYKVLIGIFITFGLCLFTSAENYDPCCSFPCQNYGICNKIGFTGKFYCDCYGTDHYGENCETPTFRKWLSALVRPSPFTVQAVLTRWKSFWDVINKTEFLHRYIMRYILYLRAFIPTWPEAHNTAADYITWDGYSNTSYYSLTLPAIPKNCPTPMGIAGPKVLPDAHELVEKVFSRTKFTPCPRGTTVLAPLYGQHFTHQGFKTNRHDRRTTFGSNKMDMSHLYGDSMSIQRALRTLQGGKMKMQKVNGEEFPPNIKDTPGVRIHYPPHVPNDDRYAMGQPFFAMLPTLMYYSTLWLREHNRMCDIMAKEHPDWDDERLFQTTRLIVTGEMLKITVEEYVQHVGGVHFQLTFEPELLHDSPMKWASNRVHVEFNTMYHWHSMMPDIFLIGGKNYSLDDLRYNMRPLTDHGMEVFTTSLSNVIAGKGAGGRNIAKSLRKVAKDTILWNRELRVRPFNHYRQMFRLPPFKSFEELTGETKLAKILSDFYGGDINAVEFFVGIMVEKRHPYKLWGLTLIESIACYSFRSVFSSVIGSPQYWRESTFGGKTGFEYVKNTTLQHLVCRNIEGCPKVRFQIPEKITEDSDQGMVYEDIDVIESHKKTEL